MPQPRPGHPLLLLHHTGARSHEEWITPLGYIAADEGYVLIASNGGARSNPPSYHNLNAHPYVRIEVGTDTLAVASH